MKNSQKGSVAVWIIVILILVIIIGGIYWYMNQNSSQPTISSGTQSQQTQQNVSNINQPVQPVAQTPSQPTSSLKTYTNTQFGFQFQYSQETTIKNTSNIAGNLNLDISFSNLSNQTGQDFYININSKPNNYTSLLNYVKTTVAADNSNQGAMPSNTTYIQKTTGNLNGYLITTKAGDAPVNTYDIFVVEHGNTLVSFQYHYEGVVLEESAQEAVGGGSVTPDLQKVFQAKIDAYNQVQKIISTFVFNK